MAAHLSNILLWSCLHPYIMECTQKASVTVHLLYHEQVTVLFSVQHFCIAYLYNDDSFMVCLNTVCVCVCVRACVCVWVGGWMFSLHDLL